VPIEGWEQEPNLVEGGAFADAQLWRRVNGCPDAHADSYAAVGRFWRRSWTECAPGTALELVLHPGAHGVPDGWATLALDWFEAVVPGPH
jgi:polyhydroxybutyrate depolymerase